MKKIIKIAMVSLIMLCNTTITSAATIDDTIIAADAVNRQQIEHLDTLYVKPDNNRESLFPESSKNLGIQSHFSWGADIGGSIDVGGDDMSTFDIDVNLGYKNKFFRLIGIGAGIHRAFGNGYNFIPIYAVIRTSFREKPSLFFLDLKGGYSFNSIGYNNSQGGAYASIGCGINLAMSNKFKSHIIISYGYFGMKAINNAAINFDGNHINYAQIKFGVSF